MSDILNAGGDGAREGLPVLEGHGWVTDFLGPRLAEQEAQEHYMRGRHDERKEAEEKWASFIRSVEKSALASATRVAESAIEQTGAQIRRFFVRTVDHGNRVVAEAIIFVPLDDYVAPSFQSAYIVASTEAEKVKNEFFDFRYSFAPTDGELKTDLLKEEGYYLSATRPDAQQ